MKKISLSLMMVIGLIGAMIYTSCSITIAPTMETPHGTSSPAPVVADPVIVIVNNSHYALMDLYTSDGYCTEGDNTNLVLAVGTNRNEGYIIYQTWRAIVSNSVSLPIHDAYSNVLDVYLIFYVYTVDPNSGYCNVSLKSTSVSNLYHITAEGDISSIITNTNTDTMKITTNYTGTNIITVNDSDIYHFNF